MNFYYFCCGISQLISHLFRYFLSKTRNLPTIQIFQRGKNFLFFFWGGEKEEVLPDLSLLQVARKFPDGEKTAHLTSFSCPSSVTVHSQLPPFLFQTAIVPKTEYTYKLNLTNLRQFYLYFRLDFNHRAQIPQ